MLFHPFVTDLLVFKGYQPATLFLIVILQNNPGFFIDHIFSSIGRNELSFPFCSV